MIDEVKSRSDISDESKRAAMKVQHFDMIMRVTQDKAFKISVQNEDSDGNSKIDELSDRYQA